MSTFALIHGAGDGGWAWHLVEEELGARGHTTVAPDLPTDESATLTDYADVVLDAIGPPEEHVVVVGHSYGAFTAPLVADRLPAAGLVFVAGMIPKPGEAPGDWWGNTGYGAAAHEQAVKDGGLTGSPDPYVAYYHDVPKHLADRALRDERDHRNVGSRCATLAFGRVTHGAHPIRGLHGGPLLPRSLHAPARSRPVGPRAG